MNRFRAWFRLKTGWIPRPVRRAIVSVIGGTLLLLALAGMVLPVMPGVIFLPLGLAILAIEFAWAARWLKKLKRTAANVQQRVRSGMGGGTAAPMPQTGCSTGPGGPPAGTLPQPLPQPLPSPPRNAAA